MANTAKVRIPNTPLILRVTYVGRQANWAADTVRNVWKAELTDTLANKILAVTTDFQSPLQDRDPVKMLETLISFLYAWDEARNYSATRGGFGSENEDLFDESWEPVLPYVEELAAMVDSE